MPSAPVRRFSLLDAMILVAATAVATAWLRIYLAGINSVHYVTPVPLRLTLAFYVPGVIPFAASYSLAGLAFHVRRPRLPFRHLRRRASFLAGVVVLMSTAFASAGMLVQEFWPYSRLIRNNPYSWARTFVDIVSIRFLETGGMVAAAWIVLALAGWWRTDSSWIDRWGRTIAWFWIAFYFVMLFLRSMPG